ncbi:hypothetical protein [Sphingomonas sp.]|jgi:predicted small lipoprotein YifL|uniref:hypothetical protein n=1 Tax=Sphingomonas sp. TaxID=28214 RepID=UPI002EDBB1B3
MKLHALAALALLSAPLAACGGKGDDALASNVEAAGENQADALEATADNLEDRAEAIEDNAEDRAEAVDDSDINTETMTPEQKAAVVNGSATVQ